MINWKGNVHIRLHFLEYDESVIQFFRLIGLGQQKGDNPET